MDNEIKNGLPEEEALAPETEETEAIEDTAEELTEEAEPDIAEENETEDDDSLCIRCGENEKEDDSDYCSECRDAMYKSKIPVLAWVSGMAVILFSIFAFVISALVSAPALQAARGDSYAAKKCWYAAYVEYTQVSSVVDELNGILGTSTPFLMQGSKINEKIIESYANCRSPLDAVYLANMMYGETAVDDMPGIRKYVDIYEDFYNNYTLMGETLEAMLDGATMEDTLAALEAFKGQEGISEVYRNYFIFNAMDYYQQTIEEKLLYVKAADEAAKAEGRDYSWLYYYEIADALCQSERYEEALEYIDALAANDKSSYRAADMQMRIAFAMGETDKASKILAEFKVNNGKFDSVYSLEAAYLRITGKLEESKLICEEGLEENDSSPELHRQLALYHLMKGDYANAYEEAFAADNNAAYLANYYMDSSSFTPQLEATLYLCTMLCKNNNITSSENASYIDQVVEYYGEYEPTAQTSAILDGTKTPEQVLTEGVCDLA